MLIKVTELNEHRKKHPNARFFAKTAFGDWEINCYNHSTSWLLRTGNLCGMGLCVTSQETVEVRYNFTTP